MIHFLIQRNNMAFGDRKTGYALKKSEAFIGE
jgi:hypothetical protein